MPIDGNCLPSQNRGECAALHINEQPCASGLAGGGRPIWPRGMLEGELSTYWGGGKIFWDFMQPCRQIWCYVHRLLRIVNGRMHSRTYPARGIQSLKWSRLNSPSTIT
jgi:hypothetical protein